jgi:NADH-quinone oxidoreductase subunit L
MVDMTPYAYLIPVFPLLAFGINIFFGRFLKTRAALISILASLASCLVALPCVFHVIQNGTVLVEGTWLSLGQYTLKFGYLLDPLSAMMLFVVTVVGTLIQIYSVTCTPIRATPDTSLT